MARSKVKGTCRICSTDGRLTWEHVPPESAFNDQRIVRATREQMLAPGPWDGKRGKFVQRGSGAYTLCSLCNNNTGSWYGTEYAEWARQGADYLQVIPPEYTHLIRVEFGGRPLRFLKQVITMFFSAVDEGFAADHPELVKFVLNWRCRDLPPKYKIDLFLVRGNRARTSGFSMMADLRSGQSLYSSEVAFFPFAVRLVVDDGPVPRVCPIEHFVDYGPDERARVTLTTVAGHIATKFPGDYRSRSRVEKEAAESSES